MPSHVVACSLCDWDRHYMFDALLTSSRHETTGLDFLIRMQMWASSGSLRCIRVQLIGTRHAVLPPLLDDALRGVRGWAHFSPSTSLGRVARFLTSTVILMTGLTLNFITGMLGGAQR